MAVRTWTKAGLSVFSVNDAWLGALTEQAAVGAAQVFTADSPLKASAGQVVEWVAPADADMLGFALNDAPTTQGDPLEFILAIPSLVQFYASFLGAGAGDNVLAAGDLYANFDLEVDADVDGNGNRGWYILDASAKDACRIRSFKNDQKPVDDAKSRPEAGDTNARVTGHLLNSITAFDAAD